MKLLDRMTGVKSEIHIKAMNKGLKSFLTSVKWTPSQAKLIKIQMIMNELEGKAGQEVFETSGKMAKLSAATGKKVNEHGAKAYVDRIEAVLKE